MICDCRVQATGLAPTLSDPTLAATVFAPTDAAFTALLTTLNVTANELIQQNAALLLDVRAPSHHPRLSDVEQAHSFRLPSAMGFCAQCE